MIQYGGNYRRTLYVRITCPRGVRSDILTSPRVKLSVLGRKRMPPMQPSAVRRDMLRSLGIAASLSHVYGCIRGLVCPSYGQTGHISGPNTTSDRLLLARSLAWSSRRCIWQPLVACCPGSGEWRASKDYQQLFPRW